MNGFDVLLLALAGVLAFVGFWKGLARILIGIVALVAAFVVAARFHEALAVELPLGDLPVGARRILAYIALLLGTMLAGAIVGWICRKLLQAAMLGLVDRAAGAVLGVAAAVLAAAFLVLPVAAYSPRGEEWLRESATAPWITVVADVARAAVPDGLAARYRESVERMRRHWADHWAAGD